MPLNLRENAIEKIKEVEAKLQELQLSIGQDKADEEEQKDRSLVQ